MFLPKSPAVTATPRRCFGEKINAIRNRSLAIFAIPNLEDGNVQERSGLPPYVIKILGSLHVIHDLVGIPAPL